MPPLPRQNFSLIVARELATTLATPMFIVDSKGVLVFYNEPAEQILGLKYSEAGALGPQEWGTRWNPIDDSGASVPPENLPLSIAFSRQRPSHMPLAITLADGSSRHLEVTAFPLFTRPGQLVGAVAIFWEDTPRT